MCTVQYLRFATCFIGNLALLVNYLLVDRLVISKTHFHSTDNYSEHDEHHSINDEIVNTKEMTKSSIFSTVDDIATDIESETVIGCCECNLLFDSASAYNSHVRNVHKTMTETPDVAATTDSPRSFECPECHKCFPEKKILNRHLKIHNPIKSHACNICNMTFAESSNLTKHMKKHTGELRNVVGKPNLCSACGKGFKWASSLSKHMKHHTGHRILTCSYCPKYYVEARSLNIHMRSHTGEKPFQCGQCSKAFTQMGNLEKHLRVCNVYALYFSTKTEHKALINWFY